MVSNVQGFNAMKGMISIIIPCYNEAVYISQSIDSAFQQTYRNIEIIVVDDGSDEKTKFELKKNESKITHLIIQENIGASAARNAGIEIAKGEFILTLDGDDYFEPDFCSRAVEEMDEKEEKKIVTCYAERFNESGVIDIIKPQPGELKDFLKYNHALGNALFRKNHFERVGGYDEKMNRGYEDWEFYIRLMKDGGRSVVIPEPLFHYRQKSESNSTRANKIKYDLLRYIYMKHKELYVHHYEEFVSHLLSRLKVVEAAERKALNKPEFRVGRKVLAPFRKIKTFFSKS